MGVITALPACAVDDRKLTTAHSSADMGGSGSLGGGSGCGTVPDCESSDGGDSGTMGGTSNSPSSCGPGICPDLNGNNVPDVTETLALNPTFDADIESWDPETGVGLGWFGMDACGHCDSGALSVTNQFAGTSGQMIVGGISVDVGVGGAKQCTEATPGLTYTIMGRAKPAADSFGGFGLEFFETADCSGGFAKSFSSPLVVVESVWHKESARGKAPVSAKSVLLRLYVTASAPAPKNSPQANVLFDNILVQTE